MQISCPKCQAEYEIDPPAAPFARDQDLVFRCSACSTPIALNRPEPTSSKATEASAPVETETKEAPHILLRQGENTYQVDDAAQLQRWIAERRVGPDDEIETAPGEWARVGDVESYSLFFKLVADAERAALVEASASRPQPEPAAASDDRDTMSHHERPGQAEVVATPSPDPVGLAPKPADPSEDDVSAARREPERTSLRVEVVDVPESQAVEDEVIVAQDRASAEPEGGFGEVVPDEAYSASPLVSSPEPATATDVEDFYGDDSPDAFSSGYFDDDDDDYLEWSKQRRKNMIRWWLMFFGALGGAAYLALTYLNNLDAQAPPPAATQAVEPESGPANPPPEAPPAEGVEAEAEAQAPETEGEPPEATAEATPEAEPSSPEPPAEPPAPASPPPPPAPKKPSIAGEIDRGWEQVDRENWSQARKHFDTVLGIQPSNPDGRYGLAYVNENQGRIGEAVAQYCSLKATAGGEIRGEVEGRLRALQKDCP